MGSLLGWKTARTNALPAGELAAIPRRGDRLVRRGDLKGFVVDRITTIEGGELHFVLQAADGEHVALLADDFFPPLGRPQPFGPAAVSL